MSPVGGRDSDSIGGALLGKEQDRQLPRLLTRAESRSVAGHHPVTGHFHDQSRLLFLNKDIAEDPGQLWQPGHHQEALCLAGPPRHGRLHLLGLLGPNLEHQHTRQISAPTTSPMGSSCCTHPVHKRL